jgi:hypothetical protein
VQVSVKNTRILCWLCLSNIPICGMIYFFLFSGNTTSLLLLFSTEFGIFTVLALVYFVRILLFFKEVTAIVAAYSIYTVLTAAELINILYPKLLNSSFAVDLETLMLMITLLAAFRSFFVKAKVIKLPFMIYGIGMAIVALPRLLVLVVYAPINYALMTITGNVGILVMLAATICLLKRLLEFLQTGPTLVCQSVIEPDSTGDHQQI